MEIGPTSVTVTANYGLGWHCTVSADSAAQLAAAETQARVIEAGSNLVAALGELLPQAEAAIRFDNGGSISLPTLELAHQALAEASGETAATSAAPALTALLNLYQATARVANQTYRDEGQTELSAWVEVQNNLEPVRTMLVAAGLLDE